MTDLLNLTPSRDSVAFFSVSSSVSTPVNVGAPAKELLGNGLSISSLKLDPRVHPLHVVQSLILNTVE